MNIIKRKGKMGFKSIALTVTALSIVGIFASTSAHAIPTFTDPVKVRKHEWRQLTDTQAFSYDQLASIYDISTGQLSGSTSKLTDAEGFREVDFTGWTWASLSDTFNLFEQIPGHNIAPSTDYDYLHGGEANSTLGDFFDESFNITDAYDDSPGYGWLEWYGLTRDRIGNYGITIGVERSDIREEDSNGNYVTTRYQDQIFYYGNETTSYNYPSGVWLYREVSEPSIIALMATGIFGLGFISRKRKLNPSTNT
jgi:hypothetical protein